MRKIAFTNQKGGVGKTTTTVNVGAGLSKIGYRVLLVDMDPQANLTYSLKIPSSKKRNNMYDVLMGKLPARDIVMRHNELDILPASIELSGAEMDLADEFSREKILKKALDDSLDPYDFILIDCPPNLGLLTLNAFTAADELIIVMQCEYLALHGLSRLMDLIEIVQQRLNPTLKIDGIVCTMYNESKKLNRNIVDHIIEHYGNKVYDTLIRDTTALAEAPSHHKTIFEYDMKSEGAKDFIDLAREIRNRK